MRIHYTDKKENKIFRKFRSGAVAKSYIYEEGLPKIWGMRKYFVIHDFATAPLWISLYNVYEENFFFICVVHNSPPTSLYTKKERQLRLQNFFFVFLTAQQHSTSYFFFFIYNKLELFLCKLVKYALKLGTPPASKVRINYFFGSNFPENKTKSFEQK